MPRKVSPELLNRVSAWIIAQERSIRPLDCALDLKISPSTASQAFIALGFTLKKDARLATNQRIEQVKELRSRGLSHREIAERVGVSRPAVGMMLRGSWGK